jgi:hypothetical protein
LAVGGPPKGRNPVLNCLLKGDLGFWGPFLADFGGPGGGRRGVPLAGGPILADFGDFPEF